MENNIKVSVILPVYNSEEFLGQCVDSLLCQTLKEVEFIFVDDGSTDSSLAMLKEYQAKDERVKIITQQNQFAGVARNNGIKKAAGEYLMFLDSDDFFEPTLLEKTYRKGKETKADIVLFGGNTYNEKTKEIKQAGHYLKELMIPEKDPFSRKDFDGDMLLITSPAPWTKLFRKEFVLENELQFQALPNTNDAYFVLTSLSKAERISTVNEALINYRTNRDGSIQNTKKKNPYCFLTALDGIYDKLHEWNIYEDVQKGFLNAALSMCVFSLNSYSSNHLKMDIASKIRGSHFYAEIEKYEDPTYYTNFANYKKLKTFMNAEEWKSSHIINGVCSAGYSVMKKNALEEKPAISVIIPVYNVEEYIGECLDSIINQTLKNIEIICINDGSKDNSLQVVQEYAKKDARIAIIDQPNSGLSASRNHGVEVSQGEYVYFIDSDDWLSNDALEKLYTRLKEQDLEILYFDAVSFFDDEELKEEKSDYLSYYTRNNDYNGVYNGLDFMTKLEENKEYRPSACLQIMKKELWENHNLRFYEGILHEDNLYTFTSLIYATRVSHIREAFYHRRMHVGSIMTTKQNFNHCFGYFVSFREMYLLVSKVETSEDNLATLGAVMKRMMINAQNIYFQLEDEEKKEYLALTPADIAFFESIIKRYCGMRTQNNKKNDQIKDLKEKIKQLKKENQRVKKSKSFKVINMLLKPYRLLKKLIKK